MTRLLRITLALALLAASTVIYAETSITIEISGIIGKPLKNVQERLKTEQHSYGDNLTDAKIHAFYQTAPANIKKALEPYGLFKASVHSELSNKHHLWTMRFDITPGPMLQITDLNVSVSGPGKNNPELKKFLADFPIQKGQPLFTEQYDKAKEGLFQIANSQGYLTSKLVKKEIQINLKNNTARIILRMDTGPRYYFGRVTFSPNPFAERFLQRFIPFTENEPFSSARLTALQQDMANSGYFQSIIVNPAVDQADHFHVPIHIEVKARKSQQYNAGIGYGTFTGPRTTVGVDLRHLTDTGQHMNAQIKYSTVLKGFAAKYYIPGKNPVTDRYVIGANIQQFLPKNGRSVSKTFAGGYIKKSDEWQHSLMLNYLTELYKIENEQSRSSQILYPNFSISRIKTDNPIYTRFGSSLNMIMQGSSKNIFSTTSFIQTEIKGKYIFSPATASRVILRGDIGYTVVKDLKKLPLTLNFFAGGLDSVRGYPYSGLGPGRYLEVASVEYQHRIIDNWSAAVFFDAGMATNHFNSSLKKSEGVGIIYHSLIGPIKLYLAHAESAPPVKRLDIEFSIGPDF